MSSSAAEQLDQVVQDEQGEDQPESPGVFTLIRRTQSLTDEIGGEEDCGSHDLNSTTVGLPHAVFPTAKLVTVVDMSEVLRELDDMLERSRRANRHLMH